MHLAFYTWPVCQDKNIHHILNSIFVADTCTFLYMRQTHFFIHMRQIHLFIHASNLPFYTCVKLTFLYMHQTYLFIHASNLPFCTCTACIFVYMCPTHLFVHALCVVHQVLEAHYHLRVEEFGEYRVILTAATCTRQQHLPALIRRVTHPAIPSASIHDTLMR